MTVILTDKTSVAFKNEISEIDPATLDRWADILVSQGFEAQDSRLAAIAAEMREAAR